MIAAAVAAPFVSCEVAIQAVHVGSVFDALKMPGRCVDP